MADQEDARVTCECFPERRSGAHLQGATSVPGSRGMTGHAHFLLALAVPLGSSRGTLPWGPTPREFAGAIAPAVAARRRFALAGGRRHGPRNACDDGLRRRARRAELLGAVTSGGLLGEAAALAARPRGRSCGPLHLSEVEGLCMIWGLSRRGALRAATQPPGDRLSRTHIGLRRSGARQSLQWRRDPRAGTALCWHCHRRFLLVCCSPIPRSVCRGTLRAQRG